MIGSVGAAIGRPFDKEELYRELVSQIASLLEDEDDLIVAMANASAAIFYTLPELNWAGFYRVTESGDLILGPFQGKVACTRIKRGRGVCGSALAEGRSLLVADVHKFPGHIACDSASNSEVVIPLRREGGEIFAVLDIDSPVLSRFEEADRRGLEAVAELFARF